MIREKLVTANLLVKVEAKADKKQRLKSARTDGKCFNSLTMMQRGQKRKQWPEEEDSDGRGIFSESQRQYVLTVSLNKYQCAQQLAEPSLRRSVLIANTLRQISLQVFVAPAVQGEVSQPPGISSPALSATIVTAAKQHSAVTVDGCSALATCPVVSLNYSSNSTEKTNHSTVISSILAALDSTIDGNPQAASRIPLRPLDNMPVPRPYEGGLQLVAHGDSREQQEDSSMEVMRSSYLGDFTVEDLFQDIDTSLVDMDIGVIGHRSTEGGHAAGDDLFLYLPPFSPFSPHSLTPSSQNAQPALIGQLA